MTDNADARWMDWRFLMLRVSRFFAGASCAVLATFLLPGIGSAATPLTPTGHYDFVLDILGMPQPALQESEGHVVLSPFANSGNADDIASLDVKTGNVQYLIRGRPRGRFLAQDWKYLVINEHPALTYNVVAFDRATGKGVGKKGLNRAIEFAIIDGNRLVAWQEDIKKTSMDPRWSFSNCHR